MKVKVAVTCSDRLLQGRIEKLIQEDPDLRLLPPLAPPFQAKEIARLRCDVLIVDRAVLFDLLRHLTGGERPSARLLLLSGKGMPGAADLAGDELADLVTRGIVAGVIPADVRARLMKKAVKAVASGELWLAARPEGRAE